MAISGLSCSRWNQPAAPSPSHQYTTLGVVWQIEQYRCNLAPSKSQPTILYLASVAGYLLPVCVHALPNILRATCYLVFSYPSSLYSHLRIRSKPSPPTATRSIQHLPNYQMAARSQMSPNNLQQLSPIAGISLKAGSNDSVDK